MVIVAEDDSIIQKEPPLMAEKLVSLSTARRTGSNSRLHNFCLPRLSWGSQKLLRCVNTSNGSTADLLDPAMRRASSPSFETPQSAPSPLRPPSRIRAQKRRIYGDDAEESAPPLVASLRPWNLRTRRAACNAPAEIGRNSNPSSSSSPSPSRSCLPSPVKPEKVVNQVRMLRSRLEGFEKGERRKFSIALSKMEIEEDFVAMKGAKPPRRPKKRARYLQRQIDGLFPGSFLHEVTPDLYKIEEKKS